MSTGFPECRTDLEHLGFRVDGAWLPPIAYTSYLPREEVYREVAHAGIHLYCFPAYLAGRGINIHSGIGPFRKGIWLGEGTCDFSDIASDLDLILGADPEARVIMRIHLDVPEWWEAAYPGECCRRRDGSHLRQSFSSLGWLESVSGVLRELIAWFRERDYAQHLIGIHLAAGGTEEWIYHFRDRFEDRSIARSEHFRIFLARRYGSLSAQHDAWSESPQLDERTALAVLEQPAQMCWRTAARDQAARDACRFHSEALTEAILYLCRTVKQASEGSLLTGAFYGYHFYIPDSRKGHTALSRLLVSDDLDYIASPNMYDRSPGKDWPPMVAVDSIRLHGTLWMAENDTRTVLTRPLADTAPAICPPGQYAGGVWEGPKDLSISRWLLRTNGARMLTHGYGGWWFDMWGGWFSDPELLTELASIQQLWERAQTDHFPHRIPPHCLCVIVDERLAEYDASFGVLTGKILENRHALGTCGRPYRIYLRNDLLQLDLADAPFLWLLGVHALTLAEESFVRNYLEAGGLALHTDLNATCLRTCGEWCSDEENYGPTLSSEELRDILERARIHAYLASNDVLYLGNGFLAIHAAQEGQKTIRFPRSMAVRQILPWCPDSQTGDHVDLTLQRHETRLFQIRDVGG